MPNSLSVDPTRTVLLRRQFAADVRGRFNVLRQQVWDLLVTDGTAGENGAWAAQSDPQKVKSFRAWLRGRANRTVLSGDVTTGEPVGLDPWVHKYVEQGWRKGLSRSYSDVRKPSPAKDAKVYTGGREEFLRRMLNNPERAEKLRSMSSRAHEDLRGVTDAVVSKLARRLSDGLLKGEKFDKIAKGMSQTIRTLSRTRAEVMTVVEVIGAHAEGQLDALEDLGVKKVSAEVELNTAGDNRVCKRCRKLNGKVYSPKGARGVIPVHPRCRCAWKPHVGAPQPKSLIARKKKRK